MSYAPVTYTGDGTTTDFAVPFPYLSEDEVSVTVDGVSTTFTLISDSIVRISPAPASGTKVFIGRDTEDEQRIVVWSNSAALTAQQLNNAILQLFYMGQEAKATADRALSKDYTGDYTAGGKRLTNIAEPVDDQDAATKSYVDTELLNLDPTFQEHVDNAQSAATNAAASESNAATSEANAATSASEAATSASNAAASEANAATSETNAATSAANAATSETNAATSESNAASSASAAATSENNAANSASSATTSAFNASSSANAASTSASNAATSESNAASSASAAATSASNAASSASDAAASASAAATSETNAAGSATAAAASESNAATSESNAASSASAAATSASNAASSESNAASSASSASTSASNAASSASAASTSATNAATSESNAASAASAAETSRINFEKHYLGEKANDPSLDNEGNALTSGALYWNTSSDEMRVYTGSVWQTFLTAGQIKSLYEGNADTNAFTNALLSKLNGVESGADVTDADNVSAAGALMKSGGTMTGDLVLTKSHLFSGGYQEIRQQVSDALGIGIAGGSSAPAGASIGLYGKDHSSQAGNMYLNHGGAPGTGDLVVRHHNGTGYVEDLRISSDGDVTVSRGSLTLASDPTNNNEATTKQYVDGTGVTTYGSRAEAEAASVPTNVKVISVEHAGAILFYRRDNSGTALTTGDGQKWSPSRTSEALPLHWGAVGDGVTDDIQKLTAWADWLAGQAYDPTGFLEEPVVFDLGGRIYAITETWRVPSGPWTSILQNGALVAVPGGVGFDNGTFDSYVGDFADGYVGWRDFMLELDSSYMNVQNVSLYCQDIANGIRSTGGRQKFRGCLVRRMPDVGMWLESGGDKRIESCLVQQMNATAAGDPDHTNPASYTAVGILVEQSDCKLINTTMSWCKKNYVATGGVQTMDFCHLFSGVVGTPTSSAILIEFKTPDLGGSLHVHNTYLDNGYVDLYNDKAVFRNCECLLDVADVAQTSQFRVYCSLSGQNGTIPRVQIVNPAFFEFDGAPAMIEFIDEAYSWGPGTDALADMMNNVVSSGLTLERMPQLLREQNTAVASRTDWVARYASSSDRAMVQFRDRTSVGNGVSFGSVGDSAWIRTPDGPLVIGSSFDAPTGAASGSVTVKTSDSGVDNVDVTADDLIVEGNGNSGITIATPNDKAGRIAFADPEGALDGFLRYQHSTREMSIQAGGQVSATFTSGGIVTDQINASAVRADFGEYKGSSAGYNIDTAPAGFTGLVHDANPGTWPISPYGAFVWIETQSIYSGEAWIQRAQYGYTSSGTPTSRPRLFHRIRDNGGSNWGAWSEVLAADGDKWVLGRGGASSGARLELLGGDATNGDLMLDPGGAGALDYMGFLVDASANNDTHLHLGRKFTYDSAFQKHMTLDPAGRVGIGTTDPVRLLDVRPITYSSSQSGGIRLGSKGGEWAWEILCGSDGSGYSEFTLSAPADSSGNTETFLKYRNNKLSLMPDGTEQASADAGGFKVGNWYIQREGAELTISGGAITPDSDFHDVTDGAGSPVDLTTINTTNAHRGARLTIEKVNSSGTITIKNGVGNIQCGSDRVMTSPHSLATFIYSGNAWKLVSFEPN